MKVPNGQPRAFRGDASRSPFANKKKRVSPSRVCKTCSHVERLSIDRALSLGASMDSIARKYGLNRNSIQRHRANHISIDFRRSVVFGPFKSEEELKRLINESDIKMVENLDAMRGMLMSRYITAFESGEDFRLVHLNAQLVHVIDRIGKLRGEIVPEPSTVVNNFFVSPQFGQFLGAVLRALAPYPDAKCAVIKAANQVRASNGQGHDPKLIDVTPDATPLRATG